MGATSVLILVVSLSIFILFSEVIKL
jgi:hypothetical protein